MAKFIRVRGVYGKPWSKMAGPIPLTSDVLKRLGKMLVESVVKEAKKDFAKQGRKPTPRGQPAGLPNSPRFFDSFDYRISGKSTIEITSSWEWDVEKHIKGQRPGKMTTVTTKHGGKRIIIPKSDGTVIYRFVPSSADKAWIHPGFAKHTFLERGIRKGREKMAEIIVQETMEMLMTGDPRR